MALAIWVKSTGWDVMSGIWPELSSLRTHIRDDGKMVRYLPPPAALVQKKPATVSHIFFPRYARDEPTALTLLSRSDAVTRLLEQCQAAPRRLPSPERRLPHSCVMRCSRCSAWKPMPRRQLTD